MLKTEIESEKCIYCLRKGCKEHSESDLIIIEEDEPSLICPKCKGKSNHQIMWTNQKGKLIVMCIDCYDKKKQKERLDYYFN